MPKKDKKEKKEEEPKNDAPFRYFHVNYQGNLQELKNLLKKKVSFDYKDMGNNAIYVKIKKEDYESFSLFIQGFHQKGTSIKNYQEITPEVYNGALLSLDKIIHG